jgi:hypothetical protein
LDIETSFSPDLENDMHEKAPRRVLRRFKLPM